MKFRTELIVNPLSFQLSHRDSVIFLGSCFSENMGQIFKQLAYETLINPHGILFGSPAMLANLARVLKREPVAENEIFQSAERWGHWLSHSVLNATTKNQLFENIQTADTVLYTAVSKASVCFITLGSAWVYRLKNENFVVGNCHKQAAHLFEKELLTTKQVVDDLRAMLGLLNGLNPELEVVFTVSPVKHVRDGLVENQLSKATLLVAVQEVVKNYSNTTYFPAYELLTEDLRDYRYYAADMAHPNDQAVNYILEKLSTAIFSTEERILNKRIERLRNAQNHRPLFPDSEENIAFQAQLKNQIEQFYTETGIRL